MSERLNNYTFVKIFHGTGGVGIDNIGDKVNAFLEDDSIHVISITPQMCTVGDQNEMYQSMTITVWYRYLTDEEMEAP